MSTALPLSHRRIVLGITGGIAAYKGAELVRQFVKAGAEVQVVLTRAAEHFVTKLTLQTLSGRPVLVEIFDLDEESRIGHIQIADRAELLVIAPATANVIARLAHGFAGDLLTTVALATLAPLVLAPAMNVNMWRHPQTQENVARLVARGAILVGPDSGDLACGWVGAGRLVEPAEIVAACVRALSSIKLTPRDLEGQSIVVTAGPTREAIDPVRFLGNRSSGKMGFAIARRAAARGANVTLIAGPVTLDTPSGVMRVDVETAAEMHEAVMAREADSACVIKAAAVGDFRAASIMSDKIKKTASDRVTLDLVKNPDILAALVDRRRARGGRRPVIVGFAAETGDLEDKARAKLAKKGCDLLVANDVAEAGSTFGSDTNQVLLLAPDQPTESLPLLTKDELADRILDRVKSLLG